MLGTVVSSMVKTDVVEVVLPQSSVAVKVTVAGAMLNLVLIHRTPELFGFILQIHIFSRSFFTISHF